MKLAVLTQAAFLFSGVLPLTDSPADSKNVEYCGGDFEACYPTMQPVNYSVIGNNVSQLVQDLLYAFLGFTKKHVDGGVMLRIRERGTPICCLKWTMCKSVNDEESPVCYDDFATEILIRDSRPHSPNTDEYHGLTNYLASMSAHGKDPTNCLFSKVHEKRATGKLSSSNIAALASHTSGSTGYAALVEAFFQPDADTSTMLTATGEPNTDLVRVGHCSTEPGMIESAFPRPTPVETEMSSNAMTTMITTNTELAEIIYLSPVDDGTHDCGVETSLSIACPGRGAYRLARVDLVDTPNALDQQ